MRDFVVLLIVCLILLGGLFTKPLLYRQSPLTLYSEQALSLIEKTTATNTPSKDTIAETTATSTPSDNKVTN